MTKVITNEKKINEVLERGIEQVFPDLESLKKKLSSGERIKLYCGFDPSAKALHIGNAIMLNKLAQFQKLGHEVVFLVGDFTGMIGDPTDKEAARQKMSREEVLENSSNYMQQASCYLDFEGENPAQLLYNSQWSDKLSFKDVIETASNFTVQQMIQREMFQKRIENEKPIYLHEFLYPLAQGYDSVAMDVDLEIGGNDQMFNMLAGRELMRAIKGKEKFVLTMKLLADDQGKKMGKSEGNAVFLDQSPEDIYGAVMSWTDGAIGIGFELATTLPMEEVKKIKEGLKSGENNPRDYKMRLAHEVVGIIHSKEKADKAQEDFVRKFQEKEVPEEATPSFAPNEIMLVDLMVKENLAYSNSDAKRKIGQGGVELGGERVEDIKRMITGEDDGKILKVGKKDFRKIVIEK